MSIKNQIVELLQGSEQLTGKQIADKLNLIPKTVSNEANKLVKEGKLFKKQVEKNIVFYAPKPKEVAKVKNSRPTIESQLKLSKQYKKDEKILVKKYRSNKYEKGIYIKQGFLTCGIYPCAVVIVEKKRKVVTFQNIKKQ